MKRIFYFDGTSTDVPEEIYESLLVEISEKDFVLINKDLVNTKAIARITDAPKKATWWGYDLSQTKNGEWYFMRDGERCYLEQHNIKEIKYVEETNTKLLN